MKAKDTLGIHVLFADQDVVLCVSARGALQRLGFSVTLAHDGVDALERFDSEPFDVVVVNATLPMRNGMQVLREIKKRDRTLPVILLGDVRSELSRLAPQEGASAYLPIPADNFDELVSAVDRAVMLREEPPAPEASPAAAPAPIVDESRQITALRALIESVRAKALAETIQLLLRASAETMGADHAVLLLADAEAGLQLHSSLGFSDQAAAAGDFVGHVGDAFAWHVATGRHTLIEYEPAPGFIGTPLIVSGQLLGVLIVYPLASEPVDSGRVVWLETFAAQGALAVQLSRLEAENQRLSPSDPLSGVLKPSLFLDLADHEFRRSWRYNQPISAIIVDVDGMRDINTASGREFGDQVLRQVAMLCRQTVRSIDLVGRHENDSFALLLLMTDGTGAKSAAERVRAGISSIDLSDARGPVRITATLGVCSYPRENCASIFDLLNVAKEAQRAARRSGANQMVQA